ncbi:acetylglutamate kinase [Bradyrhizobium sp. GM24.11]
MSKLDFITYLRSTLTAASTKLLAANPNDRATAGRLNQIVRTADDNVSDGHWAQIAPLYEPFAPKLQLAVMHLNADIVAGQRAAPDFDTYFGMLAADVQS